MYCYEGVLAAMNVQESRVGAVFPQINIGPRLRLSRRASTLWLAYLALAVVLAIPMLVTEVPLGVDTLNHLARIHVRAHLENDADLRRLFEIRENFIPYMGLDWMLTPLARIMPTLLAGRMFIVLTLWSIVGAVVILQRVFTGRIGFEPLLMSLVSYNALLAWGLLNYLVGVVGALLGLAAWHALRSRSWPVRLVIFTGVATGLYATHLLALALYGAMLGAYEVFGRSGSWRTPIRDWLILGIQFLPSALLYLQINSPLAHATLVGDWGLSTKPLVLASPFLFTGGAGGASAGLLVFVVCIFLLYRLTRMGLLRWNRQLSACAAVLALLGLAAPTILLGVALVDMRFPSVAAFLAIAAIRTNFISRYHSHSIILLLGFAAALQTGLATLESHACDRQYSEVRSALAAVPRGSVLTAVMETEAPSPAARCTDLPIYYHLPQLMVIDRSGYSPDFFASVTSVAVRGNRETDFDPISAHLLTPDMLPSHGYVLWMHLGNHARPPPSNLELAYAGSFFNLFVRP